MNITLKRAYEKPGKRDGLRILVDRLWPRGLAKADARIDVWMKSLAPSSGLRRWYGHDRQKWDEFRRKYFAELDANPAPVEELHGLIETHDVVLLFGTRDTECNNAVALKEYLETPTQTVLPDTPTEP